MNKDIKLLLIIIVSVALFGFYLIGGFTKVKNEYEGPFVGYRSQVFRINPLDLEEAERKAVQSGFIVDHGKKSENDEHFEIPSFLGSGKFYLSYGSGTNSTHYHYDYMSNDTGRLNEFWDKFGYYFNLSETRLEKQAVSTPYGEDVKGKELGHGIECKPIWSRVIEDCGVETRCDTSRVGEMWLEFDSGAEFYLKTEYTRVMYETESDGVEVLVILKMDNETDIELFLECDERVDDPAELFYPVFEIVGIPVSVLKMISIPEIEVGICGTA